MRKIFLVVAIALIVSSCAKQASEEKEQAQKPQIMLSASFSAPDTTIATSSIKSKATATSSIETNPQAATRATATAFEAGDQLGLFVVKAGQGVQSADNLVDNARMVVATDGVIKGDPTVVYYPESSVSIYSYYPHNQSGDATADALGVQVGIRTDQTDFLSVKLSDLCFGSLNNVEPTKSAKAISFSHKFSQIRVDVSAYAGCPAVKQVRLLGIKDSALLNIETGVVTLKSHVAEILPNKRAENSYLAVIPAQTLTGACVAIDLADGKTFVYNAISPIDLTQSATNSLNLLINDKGVVSLKGEPSISPWTGVSGGGVINSAVENEISLYWLSPHADYATADKVTLTITDPLGVVREVDLVPIVDPKSSSEYAIYNLNLTLAGTTYPLTISRVRIYKGATLLRDCLDVTLAGKTLAHSGAHTLGINLTILISEHKWENVSGYGESKTITITTTGGADWTASATGTGLSVSPTSGKSGQTATITWGLNIGHPAPATRTGKVVFETNPNGAAETLNCTQAGAVDRIKLNGLWWAVGNLIAEGSSDCKVGAPGDGGLYFQYGGLIGYKGGANGDGTGITNATTHPNGKWWNGAAAYSVADVAVKPTTYLTQATWPFYNNVASGGFGYYYFNTFSTKYADFQSQANANNPTLGIGDPCAYYLGSPWRLPTVYELSAITGRTDEDWVTWGTAGVTGTWEKTDGPKSAIGAWFGPTATTNPTVNTDLFVPASGLRNNNDGAFYWVSIYGYQWSSSVLDAFSGFNLRIHESSGVYPRAPHYRAFGFPVRCVQDLPHNPQPPTADQIVTINGLKWTKGNLVANGRLNCKVGEPGDGGLYFQYGGLIGYKGGANGDGVGVIDATTHSDGKYWGGAAAYSAHDVAVAPAGYTHKTKYPDFSNVASGGFGYYYYNSFVAKNVEFQTQNNANNPTLGIGDPCTYYLGSPWRLPTIAEFTVLSGNSSENWVVWSTAGVTGRWENNGPKSSKGAWFGPNSRSGKPTVNTDLFMTATGYRGVTGTLNRIGLYGWLWNSTNYDYQRAFHLGIHETSGVIPKFRNWRAHAFPVRCVSN